MNRPFLLLLSALVLASCGGRSGSADKVGLQEEAEPQRTAWEPFEAGFISKDVCNKAYPYGHWISLPMAEGELENFELFYFSTKPQKPGKPNVLYITGGPGGITGPTGMDSVARLDANVFYFHIRGTGCSQLPLSNSYDRFIRTRYAASDIEAIRKDLGIEKWDAIYGHSYGTFLAHEYLSRFNSTQKLILEGTFVPQEKDDWSSSRDSWVRDFLHRMDPLKTRLTPEEIDRVTDKYLKDLSEVDRYGPSHILLYQWPGKTEFFETYPILEKSRSFFIVTFLMYYSGWSQVNPIWTKIQNAMAGKLLKEYFPGKLKPLEAFESETLLDEQDRMLYGPRISGSESLPGYVQQTRVPDVISTYDSTSSFVLKCRKLGKTDCRASEYVGLASDYQPPYDPTKHPIYIPTLMLHGSADLATPLETAKEYFKSAVQAEKMMITVTGAGHRNFLPKECMPKLFELFMEKDLNSIPSLFKTGGICFTPDGFEID